MGNFFLVLIIFFVFASLAGFLKWVLKPSPEEIGARGEIRTAGFLRKLPENDYYIYNDVLLRFGNSTTQIDHVVISRYGVFVIETKNRHGKIYGSEDKEFWSQYLPQRLYKYRGNQEFKLRNPIWQNNGHIRSLRRIITDNSVPFYGIIVFPPDAKIKVNTISPVMSWRRVNRYIRQFSDVALSDETVSIIRGQLEAKIDYNPEDQVLHIQNVQKQEERRNRKVEAGICPLCGGNLILRNGRNGRFYGCSNYPRCKYTLNC